MLLLARCYCRRVLLLIRWCCCRSGPYCWSILLSFAGPIADSVLLLGRHYCCWSVQLSVRHYFGLSILLLFVETVDDRKIHCWSILMVGPDTTLGSDRDCWLILLICRKNYRSEILLSGIIALEYWLGISLGKYPSEYQFTRNGRKRKIISCEMPRLSASGR
jgi:hypothetical protein